MEGAGRPGYRRPLWRGAKQSRQFQSQSQTNRTRTGFRSWPRTTSQIRLIAAEDQVEVLTAQGQKTRKQTTPAARTCTTPCERRNRNATGDVLPPPATRGCAFLRGTGRGCGADRSVPRPQGGQGSAGVLELAERSAGRGRGDRVMAEARLLEQRSDRRQRLLWHAVLA